MGGLLLSPELTAMYWTVQQSAQATLSNIYYVSYIALYFEALNFRGCQNLIFSWNKFRGSILIEPCPQEVLHAAGWRTRMAFSVEAMVRGHVYRSVWTPTVGEELPCRQFLAWASFSSGF